jgi:hypothetical protein
LNGMPNRGVPMELTQPVAVRLHGCGWWPDPTVADVLTEAEALGGGLCPAAQAVEEALSSPVAKPVLIEVREPLAGGVLDSKSSGDFNHGPGGWEVA